MPPYAHGPPGARAPHALTIAPAHPASVVAARPRWVVPIHILGVALVQASAMAMAGILPIIARKRFDANEWETLLITATPTIFFSLSIFWNDVFQRRRMGPYLVLFWLVACLPIAFIAQAHSYWGLLIPHLIACVGGAGYHPAAGELLRDLYPEHVRGRIYAVIWGASMVFGALIGYAVGYLLKVDGEAFRYALPGVVAAQAVGIALLILLSHASGHAAKRAAAALVARRQTHSSLWSRVWGPISHAKEVLAADPVFARYEGAYMTYGVGWMIAYALLPILVTEKLKLEYDTIAASTQVAYLLALVAMIYPAGILLDRMGAVRSTAISFAMLALYPLGLALSRNAHDLTFASIVFGISHAGASMGWMLGPVAMAPSPDKVPQYVAIHATLVGVRGKLFQFLGVLLFSLTGSFTVPLILASAAYLWAAAQMWRLLRVMRERKHPLAR